MRSTLRRKDGCCLRTNWCVRPSCQLCLFSLPCELPRPAFPCLDHHCGRGSFRELRRLRGGLRCTEHSCATPSGERSSSCRRTILSVRLRLASLIASAKSMRPASIRSYACARKRFCRTSSLYPPQAPRQSIRAECGTATDRLLATDTAGLWHIQSGRNPACFPRTLWRTSFLLNSLLRSWRVRSRHGIGAAVAMCATGDLGFIA